MKALLHSRLAGKLTGAVLFFLPGLAMAHPGHGGSDALGVFHHLPGPLELALAAIAAWLAFRLGSRNSRA